MITAITFDCRGGYMSGGKTRHDTKRREREAQAIN